VVNRFVRGTDPSASVGAVPTGLVVGVASGPPVEASLDTAPLNEASLGTAASLDTAASLGTAASLDTAEAPGPVFRVADGVERPAFGADVSDMGTPA